ncbi:MAG: TIGR03545 family protein [Spirochaetia bacterium]|nr:TIGR03545 family protein [Spirochaetia bacterium]
MNAKILGRVFIPKDREWLKRLFRQDAAGVYALAQKDFGKEELKRLKALGKSIKQNSGLFSRPKALIAAVLIALVCGGYYFFRNALIEKALVSALELVFQAKASVSGLDFDLFDIKLSWNHLEVANRDRPMKNLFELGYSEADFSLWNLLKARFVVEDLEVRDVRWNTDRTVSGEIPHERKKEEESSGGGFASELAGSVMASLSSFDPKAVLESQLDKLATPKTALRVKEELQAQTEAWKGRIAEARKEAASLKAQAEEFRGVNAQSLKTPEEILAFVTKIDAAAQSLRGAKSSAESLKRDFEATMKTAASAKTEVQRAVQKDYAFAASLVNLGSGGLMSIASGLFNDFAREHLGGWYGYGLRAIEIARSLPKSDAKEKAEEKAPERLGRTIAFPVTDNQPKLWIKNIAFNTEGNKEQKVAGRVTDITGAPDLVGKPTAFDVSVSLPGKVFELGGSIDMRRDAKTDADMRLSAKGIPIKVWLPSPVLTIKSIEGPLEAKASMRIMRAGGMGCEVAGVIAKPKLEREGKRDRVSDMTYSVLSSVRAVDLDVGYSVSADKKMDIKISSSLDKSLREGFVHYIKSQESVYRAQIEEELKKRLNAHIAENEALQKAMGELHKQVGDNLTDVEAYRKLLDGKKQELEDRARVLAREKAGGALKELEKKLPALPKGLPF